MIKTIKVMETKATGQYAEWLHMSIFFDGKDKPSEVFDTFFRYLGPQGKGYKLNKPSDNSKEITRQGELEYIINEDCMPIAGATLLHRSLGISEVGSDAEYRKLKKKHPTVSVVTIGVNPDNNKASDLLMEYLRIYHNFQQPDSQSREQTS